MKIQTINILLTGLFAFSSVLICCKDEEEETPVDPQPTYTIEIEEPAAGATFDGGDTVHIHAMITTSIESHGWELNLINTSDSNKVVFTKSHHDHGKSFHIEEIWVNDVHDHSAMKLQISSVKDHAGNKATREVEFHCHH